MLDSPIRAKVLVVDDQPANLLALRAVIEAQQVEVVTASSGVAALAELERDEFAVILLDVIMPELDGLSTLERLRGIFRARTTPVIVMTALGPEQGLLKRAYALGAADYLNKPIEPEILVPKLDVFVTLWRQAREVQQQAKRLAAKDRHIGILAHDLRTPLATIAMASARLQQCAHPSTIEHIARITRAAKRMANLADDVLDFARAAAAHLPLAIDEIDLTLLCRELVDDFSATHPEVAFSHKLDEAVRGSWDAARLQQAFSNLIGNAVKYGNGQVHVALHALGGKVLFSVENGGTPIAQERLELLFEPFERGTEREHGAGLGLYIVREIAHAHRGEVTVSSSEQRTVFTVRLPMERSREEAVTPIVPASMNLEEASRQAS